MNGTYVWSGDRLLAMLKDEGDYLRVVRTHACSIGEYFWILSELFDLGYSAR